MALTDRIHFSYAERDEAKAKEVVASIIARVRIEYSLYSLSEADDKETFLEEVITPSIEAADHIIFLYTKEGALDPLLQSQFTLASNLNKPIIPVVIESSAINIGYLKVRSPFSFRTSPLFFDDEKDRIKLVEQVHSVYGLSRRGDIYGSNVRITADGRLVVRRGSEVIGWVVKGKPFDITLSKGQHMLVFATDGSEDADWAEYALTVPDNDSSIEIRPCIGDVEHVRDNTIKDQLFDPTNEQELEWDTLADTRDFKLSRTSQDNKKRDIAIYSFLRKYQESLKPRPVPHYTEYRILPKKYVYFVCLLLTVGIWGKAVLWLGAFALYLISFFHINLAGDAWDWLWDDTNFDMLLWALAVLVAYKVIVWAYESFIHKRDEIRNNAERARVTAFNDKLYTDLNGALAKFLISRNWKPTLLERIKGAYPETKLSFDYSRLPDKYDYYNDENKIGLDIPQEAPTPLMQGTERKPSSGGKIFLGVLLLLAIGFGIYYFSSKPSDGADSKDDVTQVKGEDGTVVYTLPGNIRFTMVKVEGGGYRMGNTSAQAWRYEKPVHNVFVSDFYICECEVTQEMWTALMGNNPSANQTSPSNPVENVSWNDCQEFIRKLNEKTGENFRLPTEAEWEYAARGGGKTRNAKYSGGSILENVGWYKGNSDRTSHPVRQLAANELGIYDMSGNVSEWVSDYYDYYPKTEQHDPTGPEKGDKRVYRGGSFESGLELTRLTIRAGALPQKGNKSIGLRLAK